MAQSKDTGADREEQCHDQRQCRTFAPRIKPREENDRGREEHGDQLEPDPWLQAKDESQCGDERESRRALRGSLLHTGPAADVTEGRESRG